MHQQRRRARYLGLVCSTTECGLAAAAEDGSEGYASVPMAGAVRWCGCPAFDLRALPDMALALLERLAGDGWDFSEPGYLGQSWRQHDLALIDGRGEPLIPALSWQCNQAGAQAAALNAVPAYRAAVGAVEARFIAAKLPWALSQEPGLLPRLRAVMTSGDWFTGRLTGGAYRLGSSDALSNGLLDQRSKRLAAAPLRAAGRRLGGNLRPEWFPPVIASDGVAGAVEPGAAGSCAAPSWRELTRRLRGWRVAAPLGDNHASAAGCGAAEYDTVVLSLGTSGTVNLPAPHAREPAGEALGFEYWDDRLFLVMLAQCGAWYERFRAEAAPGVGHDELNRMAMSCPPDRIVRVPEPAGAGAALTGQTGANLPAQTASTQCSIALEMLDRVRAMLPSAAVPIRSFVLTGGLSRSPLINGVLYAGLRMLAERDGRVAAGARILVNDRPGPLAYKTDALGALVNARIAAGRHNAAGGRNARDVIAADRRRRPCTAPRPEHERRLRRLIDDAGRASSSSPVALTPHAARRTLPPQQPSSA